MENCKSKCFIMAEDVVCRVNADPSQDSMKGFLRIVQVVEMGKSYAYELRI